MPTAGTLHHRLGYTAFQTWDRGRSWQLGPTYLVIEQSSAIARISRSGCVPG